MLEHVSISARILGERETRFSINCLDPADAGVQTISIKPWAQRCWVGGHVVRLSRPRKYTQVFICRFEGLRQKLSLRLSSCFGCVMVSSLVCLGRRVLGYMICRNIQNITGIKLFSW